MSKFQELSSLIWSVADDVLTGDAGSDYFHERTNSFVFAGGCQSAQIETLQTFA